MSRPAFTTAACSQAQVQQLCIYSTKQLSLHRACSCKNPTCRGEKGIGSNASASPLYMSKVWQKTFMLCILFVYILHCLCTAHCYTEIAKRFAYKNNILKCSLYSFSLFLTLGLLYRTAVIVGYAVFCECSSTSDLSVVFVCTLHRWEVSLERKNGAVRLKA